MDCVYPGGGVWCHRRAASSGRVSPTAPGFSFLDAGRLHWILASRIRCFPRSTGGPRHCWVLASQIQDVPRRIGGRRKMFIEKLWREFFSDPSQWWDQRLEKRNARHPDFKHKKRRDGLFIVDFSNPPWVEEKLAALPPGSFQSSILSWNKRLARFVTAREYEKVIESFHQMQLEDMSPNNLTFVSILSACAGVACLEVGKRIHKLIIESGHESDVYVGNGLVDMYAKCSRIEDARRVFNKMPVRNLFSWNAMIHGYVKSGQRQKALELSRQMSMEGVKADHFTFVGVLKACAGLGALQEGRLVHQQIVESGCDSNVHVQSCLVDMYAKCGSIDAARRVFDRITNPNLASWTAMLLGYVKCGEELKALEIFRQMQSERFNPDPLTFTGLLNVCATVGALEEGRCVHKHIIQSGCETDVSLGNSLIHMYAKCGSLEDACRVFKQMPMRNVDSWNAMLGGFSMHGFGKESLEGFEQMHHEGVTTDGSSVGFILSACRYGGLVDECLHYFKAMESTYNTSPTVDHYACLFDLLGRAGRLHEAEDMMKMIGEPDATLWMCLLGACRAHGNTEIGERVAKRVLELDPEFSTHYLMYSDLYTHAGR